MVPNYSLYAIPAFWVLSLVPHEYSVIMMSRATNGAWNNANPRSTSFKESLTKKVSAETYATFERARAAHQNSLEAMPLLAAAIILGNMARLSNKTLNLAALIFLLLRTLYIVLYIRTTSKKRSFARTAVYSLSVVCCMTILIKAANEYCYGQMSK